jgi:hypothetical protein
MFNIISSNSRILYFHCSIIVSTDNDITYNGKSHAFLSTISDMSLNKLSRMVCGLLGLNIFKIEVEII